MGAQNPLTVGPTSILDLQVRSHVESRQLPQAMNSALNRLADALGDLGLAQLAAGDLESAVKSLENALNTCPTSHRAFHNLVSVLSNAGLLHTANLHSIQRHILRMLNELPWMHDYVELTYMPICLNVLFVWGKCNLRCRMCTGTHAANYPNQFGYLTAEDFRKTLAAAPSAKGVTLSAGDSDPFLHPEIESIIAVAREHGVHFDLFTNGHALTAPVCRKLIESGVCGMINFSIDAATPETYKRIRGADFKRVIGRIEMLQAMKKELGQKNPWLSMSLVAMADNIQELPEYVRLAQRLGAGRVYVEDLNGWSGRGSENKPAIDNPDWPAFIREAKSAAAQANIRLQLPPRFEADQTPAASKPRFSCCTWVQNISLDAKGGIGPCCMIHEVIDMGNIHDGPVMQNEKFVRAKRAFLDGRILQECLDQDNCVYVQQQKELGNPLRLIPAEELAGIYHPERAKPELAV